MWIHIIILIYIYIYIYIYSYKISKSYKKSYIEVIIDKLRDIKII